MTKPFMTLVLSQREIAADGAIGPKDLGRVERTVDVVGKLFGDCQRKDARIVPQRGPWILGHNDIESRCQKPVDALKRGRIAFLRPRHQSDRVGFRVGQRDLEDRAFQGASPHTISRINEFG